jgi:hypothetical protein
MNKDTKNELLALYSRYLSLIDSVKGLSSPTELTAELETLLEVLFSRWHAGAPLSVREAMQLVGHSSSATLFKRIRRLRQMGFVVLNKSQEDPRKGELVPTSRALEYFSQRALAMRSVCSAHEPESRN